MTGKSKLSEVLLQAKKLFFPGGKSSKKMQLIEQPYYLADFSLTETSDLGKTLQRNIH